MFGEKSIYGICEVTVDEKSRIVLPAFTYAEKSDELVLFQNNYFYEILRVDILDERINYFHKLIENASTLDEVELLKNYLCSYSEKILSKDKLDCNRMFNSHGFLEKNQKYKIIGSKNKIFIKKVDNNKNR